MLVDHPVESFSKFFDSVHFKTPFRCELRLLFVPLLGPTSHWMLCQGSGRLFIEL